MNTCDLKVNKIFKSVFINNVVSLSRPTKYVILALHLRHSTFEIDLIASFPILIRSEFQRNIFSAYNLSKKDC